MKTFQNLIFITYFASLLVTPSTLKQYVGYFASWSDIASSDPAQLGLALLPPYVTMVNIAFLNPDNTYAAGSLSFEGTGLGFQSEPQIVKDAIGIAKSKGIKVLISVGGYEAHNWAGLNEDGIAAFIQDFGLDGVDIDYEPRDSMCTITDATVSCTSDQEFQDVVNRIGSKLPDSIVATAISSIGAYGEGEFAQSQPQGVQTGIGLNLMKSDAAQYLDIINIMAYDAGNDYDPKEGFRAFKTYFPRQIMLGVEVPKEACCGHTLTMAELNELCDYVNEVGAEDDGMMIWSLHKIPEPDQPISPDYPDGTMISQEICRKFGLQGCDIPLNLPGSQTPQLTGDEQDAAAGKTIALRKSRSKCFGRKISK